jgi:SpoVK/Ycf46/Vps4 family AAA+-type ATPase
VSPEQSSNELHELGVILRSRFPLVAIESHEEPRVVALLERIAESSRAMLFVWSLVDGLRRAGRVDAIPMSRTLTECLAHVNKTSQGGLYVLLDAHPFLDDPLNVRLMRQIAAGFAKTPRTLVLVSQKLELVPELARVCARFKLQMPDAKAIETIVREEAHTWSRERGIAAKAHPEAMAIVCRQLAGLSADDVRRMVRRALEVDGAITHDDVPRIVRLKHEATVDAGVLTLEIDTASFADVGGLNALRRWLELRRKPFLEQQPGLDRPRGIMLLGVQGGGKSLAAKAVAGVWGVPLLRLDFGTLYNKFFGETERNLRDSLAAAESMAPCVLWIDEIEKGIAGDAAGGSDGGVSRRVLGTLLTWLAERKSAVFIVATANDIESLPPELVRKGRLDEIFFVDLPDAPTRLEIFAIHLRKRKLDGKRFDLPALASGAEGFSGAEIEQAIVAALYESLASGKPVDTNLILEEIARTRPLSVTMAERIARLRAWAVDRTARAD